MPLEITHLSFADLIREFSVLEQWFANPENSAAQLQGDKRLMSAEEKLALVGGVGQVRANLRVLPRNWHNSYLILLACRQEPMIGYELSRLGDIVGDRAPGEAWGKVGNFLELGTIYNTANNLVREGALLRMTGLTWVSREAYDPEMFEINRNRTGHLTTEHGLRIVRHRLMSATPRGFSGVLVPTPVDNLG